MLPTLEGLIARRVLLNFWVDAAVARRLVPAPLEVATHNGLAVAGVCLLRLEHVRPRGMPVALGIASENMAHRIAIRYPTRAGWREGVFIWRRETDCGLLVQLGGRLFPGVHRRAEFRVRDDGAVLDFDVSTEGHEADVRFYAGQGATWTRSALFASLDEVSSFFARGDCGFSCSADEHSLEGLRLRPGKWGMAPLAVDAVHAAFYADPRRFPPGSVGFDGAVLMSGIPHQWEEVPGEEIESFTAARRRAPMPAEIHRATG